MTKQLSEVFGLPNLEDVIEKIDDTNEDVTTSLSDDEVARMTKALENSHALEASLRDPDGTIEHAQEMDKIFAQAMKVHEDAVDLAFNMEAKNAGSVLSPAASFLDMAMKASRSKLDSKLKAIKLRQDQQKLQMDQEQHDHNLRKNIEDGIVEPEAGGSGKFVADRNELLRRSRNPDKQ